MVSCKGRTSRRKTSTDVQPSAAPRGTRTKIAIQFTLCVVIIAVMASAVWVSMQPAGTPVVVRQIEPASNRTPLDDTDSIKPKTLSQLLRLPVSKLKHVDIARMNLLCAKGLPGAEHLDVEATLAKLDHWAKRVKDVTRYSLPDFCKAPQEFHNSEPMFRVLLIIKVLQKELGVHYNTGGARTVDFSNTRGPFINGMLNDHHGGTCASMPVLYTAVARRLGYPVKLVLAKTHIFARWVGKNNPNPVYRERFNIEGTNVVFSHHPDSYYRHWPYPISNAEMAQGWYLTSLDPATTLAVFLQIRGTVLMCNGRFREAEAAYTAFRRLAPINPLINRYIAGARRAQSRGRLAFQFSERQSLVGGLGLPIGVGVWPEGRIVDPVTGRNPVVARRMAQEHRMEAESQRRNQLWRRQTPMFRQTHRSPAGSPQPWPNQRPQPGMPPYGQPYQQNNQPTP